MSGEIRFARTLRTLLLILGITLASAGHARANWMVNGFETPVNQLLESFAQTQFFKLLVPKQSYEISCEKFVTEPGAKLIYASSEGTGAIKFSSCKTLLKGTEQPNCKPVEPIVIGIKATLILHNSLTYVLFSPTMKNKFGESIFAEISAVKGELCVPFETISVRGTMVAECLNGALETGAKYCELEMETHRQQQASAALFTENPLRLGKEPTSNPVVFDGIVGVKLVSGSPWSGII